MMQQMVFKRGAAIAGNKMISYWRRGVLTLKGVSNWYVAKVCKSTQYIYARLLFKPLCFHNVSLDYATSSHTH